MVRAMSEGEGGRGNRAGGGSTGQGSRHNDPGVAPQVGRRTLVEQAPTGVPPAPAKLDENGSRAPTGVPPVQRKVGDDGEASASVPGTAASLISILDLFGRRPQPASADAAPVQHKSVDEADDATRGGAGVAEVAGRGVAGAGSPLPHLDLIQESFGGHDVSGVQAHHGAAAANATHELGAKAYAFGNAVAFGGSPDLHTAAHEAAHVVQQRGGVRRKGNIDQPGDTYERHADAVADRVVAGQSAESLLDQMAGGSGAAAVVQRRSEPGALVTATEYLKLNDRAAGDAIMRHLLAITPPPPHPRLAWHNLGAFHKRFINQLDRIIYVFDNPPDLAQLVHPQDPYAMIDSVRPVAAKQHGAAVGPWDWQPSVGTALAEMIEEALVASLYRIGPRWLLIAELAGNVSGTSVIVDPDAIPRSHPMDRAVVPALCQQGVLAVLADKQHKAKPKSSSKPVAQPAGVGLRPVQYVWLGKETHGELWNWVRATSPADATAEEVSAQLFDDTAERHGEKHGDYLAFAMTSAPPLFGLPGHWAIKFEESKAYAPATVPASSDESERNLVTLAGSSVADAQALLEAKVTPDAKGAKPAPGTGAAVGALAQDAFSQAMYLKKTLASWHLDKVVDPTLSFLGRRMGELADASKLTKWQPVLAGQKDKLSRIGAGIVEIDRAVAGMGLSNKQADDARPLRDILRIYADAAGTSHLMQTSETLLQRAAALQAMLPLRGVQSATRDLGASADMLRDSTPQGDHERSRLSGAANQIDDDSRRLQSRMMRGDKVDPDEIDQVTVNAGEIALKSKVHAIAVQLEALEQAAHDAGDGFFAAIATLFSGDFRGLEFETQVMKDSLEGVTRDMDWQAQAAGLGMRVENAKDLDDYHREMMRVRKEALARAQGQFATMAANDRIKNFLSKGATLVKWQSFRTACVKLAVLIGVSIVGGALGGMVARGAGGMLMSSGGVAAMEDLSMGAQMIARGSGLVTETAVTSVGQTAIFGDKLSDAFLENMLMSLGSAGILKAIGHQAEMLVQVERASEGLWAKAGVAGKLVLKEGAAITGHTIMGAALGYVSHKIVTGKTQPPPETLEEWLLQGASIAVGRYVGKAMEARLANAQKLAAIKGFAAGQKLLAATTALREHALRAEANPQAKEAAALLARRHDVLSDEIRALDELETSPEMMKASGLHLREIKQMRADVHEQLAEVHSRAFAETPLHLAGLEELIPGALWSGTEAQVLEAIRTADESGISTKAKEDPQGGRWHVEIEGRKVEIEVRSDSKPPAKLTPAELESRGAHAVPGARFSGLATQGNPKAKITLEQAVERAHHAVTILDGVQQQFLSIDSGGNVWVSVGAEHCLVDITVGDAMADVAQHTYTRGMKHARIKISEHARIEDVTRAVAHELAEIRGLMGDATRKVTDEPALARGSTADKMQHHDLGRKAELEILRYELESQPSRRAEILDEIEKLVDHLGLDRNTIAADPRARKMLGDSIIKGIDLMNGKKRLKVSRSAVREPQSKVERGNWEFNILVELPGMPDHLIAQGHAQLDSSGRPLGGPDFSIDKVRVINGSEYRIDIEGINSLTDFVLDEAIKAFTKDFGHPPSKLQGILGDDNKAIFQREYANQIAGGATIDVAKQRAAAKTPFVAARARKGYTRLDVEPSAETVNIVMGHPPRVHQVPARIEITARKP